MKARLTIDRDRRGSRGGRLPGRRPRPGGPAIRAVRPGSAPRRRLGRRVPRSRAPPPARSTPRSPRWSRRLEAAPDDWEASAALGIAYVQQARDHLRPVHVPARPGRPQPVAGAPAHGQRRGPRRARHPGGGPARLRRRAPMGSPGRAKPLRSTPTSTASSATPSSSSGATGAAFGSFQRMVDTRPNLASYAQGQLRPRAPRQRRRRDRRDASGLRRGRRSGGRRLGGGAHRQAPLRRGPDRGGRAWFRRARAADPGSMEAEAGLALSRMGLRRPPGGDRRLRTAGARYPSPDHVAVLGDLYAAAGDREAAAAQYELVRAEARLFRANGVDTDLEIALFEADHARVARLGAGGAPRRPRRVGAAPERPRRGRLAWALYANGHYRRASALRPRPSVSAPGTRCSSSTRA